MNRKIARCCLLLMLGLPGAAAAAPADFILIRGTERYQCQAVKDNAFIPDFYMSRYETTNQEVLELFNKAITRGLIAIEGKSLYLKTTHPGKTLLLYADGDAASLPWRLYLQDGKLAVNPLGRRHPCVNITAQGGRLFCNLLSEQEGLKPFYKLADRFLIDDYYSKDQSGYRLPRNAWWEYAASGAGKGYPWVWGNTPLEKTGRVVGNFPDISFKKKVANYSTRAWVFNNYDDGHPWTAPVGSFPPNGLGLHDMAGNVSEHMDDIIMMPVYNSRDSSWRYGTLFYKISEYSYFGSDSFHNDSTGIRVVRLRK